MSITNHFVGGCAAGSVPLSVYSWGRAGAKRHQHILFAGTKKDAKQCEKKCALFSKQGGQNMRVQLARVIQLYINYVRTI